MNQFMAVASKQYDNICFGFIFKTDCKFDAEQ